MRKIVSILIMMIACCNLSFSFSFVKSDAKNENLKGKVKKVTTYRVEKQLYFHADTVAKYKRLKKALPEYERTLGKVADYNMMGMKTYNDDWYKEYITYDPRNTKTLLFKTEKRYDSDGSLRRIYEQTFDEEWIPTTAKAVNGEGNLIFTETYNKKLLPDGKIEINCEHTSADGSITYSTLLVRPDLTMERLIHNTPLNLQDIEMDAEERPTHIVEKRNGQENNVMIEYNSDGSNVYLLDANGNKILKTAIRNDSFGNPVSKTDYNPQGGIEGKETTVYKYDSKGNWIRREITSDSKKDVQITEREIEYYN